MLDGRGKVLVTGMLTGDICQLDPNTGEPVALCDGGFLTALRTGAATGATTGATTGAPTGATTGLEAGDGTGYRSLIPAPRTPRGPTPFPDEVDR